MPFSPSSPKNDKFEFKRGRGRDSSPPLSPQTRPAPSMLDIRNAAEHSHNPSAQHNVVINNDPALDRAHEHHHAHIHHDANAEKGRHDDIVYSEGTTSESRVTPHQDPQDHDLHRRKQVDAVEKSVKSNFDSEKGSTSVGLGHIQSEEDPQTHAGSTFYQRYRIFFHILIWSFFTGSVYLIARRTMA